MSAIQIAIWLLDKFKNFEYKTSSNSDSYWQTNKNERKQLKTKVVVNENLKVWQRGGIGLTIGIRLVNNDTLFIPQQEMWLVFIIDILLYLN